MGDIMGKTREELQNELMGGLQPNSRETIQNEVMQGKDSHSREAEQNRVIFGPENKPEEMETAMVAEPKAGFSISQYALLGSGILAGLLGFGRLTRKLFFNTKVVKGIADTLEVTNTDLEKGEKGEKSKGRTEIEKMDVVVVPQVTKEGKQEISSKPKSGSEIIVTQPILALAGYLRTANKEKEASVIEKKLQELNKAGETKESQLEFKQLNFFAASYLKRVQQEKSVGSDHTRSNESLKSFIDNRLLGKGDDKSLNTSLGKHTRTEQSSTYTEDVALQRKIKETKTRTPGS